MEARSWNVRTQEIDLTSLLQKPVRRTSDVDQSERSPNTLRLAKNSEDC